MLTPLAASSRLPLPRTVPGFRCALGLFMCSASLVAGEPSPATLAERFAHPPPAFRILKIIHPWPDQPQRQDELIRSLQAQGFGGEPDAAERWLCTQPAVDFAEEE